MNSKTSWQSKRKFKLAFISAFIAIALCAVSAPALIKAYSAYASEESNNRVEELFSKMTTDDKISQLINPCFRTWNETSNSKNVTNLDDFPEIKTALASHQYGGIILFGANIVDTEQNTRFLDALQVNNAKVNTQAKIPYITSVDQEGGRVCRIDMGVRGTGSMAIGATGSNAIQNARTTGNIFGRELNVLGYTTNFAPDVDINSNASNPVIGTRSFSDDANRVAELGINYSLGAIDAKNIACYKHFPGHGDTSTDSHSALPTVLKTYDELKASDLIPFKAGIDNNAVDMIMTAHIALPNVTDEKSFDGKTSVPATMSKKIMTDILRKDMWFDGVVITDSLGMAGVNKEGLVEGKVGSVEYKTNLCYSVIMSGVDILLMPYDLTSTKQVNNINNLVLALDKKYEQDSEFQKRVDESVMRVLKLKEKYKVLDTDTTGKNIDAKVENAKAEVGKLEDHAKEKAIADEAITLIKNDNDTVLPLSSYNNSFVFAAPGSLYLDIVPYIVLTLEEYGVFPENTYCYNLDTHESYGDPNSTTKLMFGSYIKEVEGKEKAVINDEMVEAINNSSAVITLGNSSNNDSYQTDSAQSIAIDKITTLTHSASSKFIYISGNLPYDATRYTNSDAIILSYLCVGGNIDPTHEEKKTGAYCANIISAFQVLFDTVQPKGTLPANLPKMYVNDKGKYEFSEEIAYTRGFGLQYKYTFTESSNSTWEKGSKDDLRFKNNARASKLSSVSIDGITLKDDDYSIETGSTIINLKPEYLQNIDCKQHSITAHYTYSDDNTFDVSTNFNVTGESNNSFDDANNSFISNTKDCLLPIILLLAILTAGGAVAMQIKRKNS